MGPAQRIFTVGHSTHELDALVALLQAAGVGAVADVRAHPGSRRMPHFNREALARELPAAGIEYAHLPQLGGRRKASPGTPNGGWDVPAFRAYADHMAGPQFAAGLQQLEELATRARTAMMCAEGAWWRCHRRLIADALLTRGWHVVHIAPDGRLSEHELTPFAVVGEQGQLTYPPPQSSLGVR